jgi:hypothetical protein
MLSERRVGRGREKPGCETSNANEVQEFAVHAEPWTNVPAAHSFRLGL